MRNTRARNKKSELDYDYLLTLDNDKACYSLTARQVYAIIGQLEYLKWATRWYSPTDAEIDRDVLEDLSDGIAKAVTNEGCEGDDMCCPEQIDAINRLLAFQMQQADDGTPQSFAPDAPDTFNGNTGQTSEELAQRNSALCAAVTGYVVGVLQQALTISGGAAAATVIAGLISAFTGQYWIIPAIIATAAGIDFLTMLDAVADTNAIRRVICAMQNNLKGRSVSQENFQRSLREVDFEGGTNEHTIWRVINSANQVADNYRNFVLRLNDNYNIAQDEDEACFDCCEPTPDLRIRSDWPVPGTPGAWVVTGMAIEQIGERRWRFTPGKQSSNDFYQLWVETIGDDCQFCVKEFYLNVGDGYSQAQIFGEGFLLSGVPTPGACLKGFNLSRPAGTFICEIEICDGGCNNSGDCTGCD